MKLINEDLENKERHNRHADIVNTYNKYLKGSTSEYAKQLAKDKTCTYKNCSEEQFNEAMQDAELTEAVLSEARVTLGGMAGEEVQKLYEADVNNQIVEALDESLKIAKQRRTGRKGDYPNILFIGEGGTGKTQITKQWANSRGVYLKNVRAAGLDESDFGGIQTVDPEHPGRTRTLSNGFFDDLNNPNSVLFLDEYNRARDDIRTNLLELVNDHEIPDQDAEGGQRFLPNFLFTVAAINPASKNYNTNSMDMAEKSRFERIYIKPNPLVVLKYLTQVFDSEIEAAEAAGEEEDVIEYTGRKKLAETLLKHRDFRFNDATDYENFTEDDIATQPRTLTALLFKCNGTKESFLSKWGNFCDPNQLSTVERILANFQNVDDKANQALADAEAEDEEPEVFASKKNLADMLDDLIQDND